MYSKEFALKIKEKVDKEKVLLVSDKSNLIRGYRILVYYYSDEETKNDHYAKLKEQGYEIYDEGYKLLYCNLFKQNKDIMILMGIYKINCYEGVK